MGQIESDKKPYHHGDLRNTLIRVGRLVLEREGSDGFDLRSVARSAGVSHAAPYRHFKDRQALVEAIVAEGFMELEQAIEAEKATAGKRSIEELTAVASAYVLFASRNPWLMREMFSGRIAKKPTPSPYPAWKAVFRIYTGIIISGQEANEIGAGDPNELAGAYWAMIHGVAILLIDDQITPYAQGEEGMRHKVAHSVQSLYRGLLPRDDTSSGGGKE